MTAPGSEGLDFDHLETLIMKRAGWKRPDDFPESLFHYTSSSAFLGIIQSDCLWFTDFRYLNDLSELRYGVELFRSQLQKRFEESSRANETRLLAFLRDQFDLALVYTDVFVFCMCEENNLLNQWRVYGRETVPVSIEFATRGFLFEEWQPYSFQLVPMLYDKSIQDRLVSEAISTGLDYYNKYRESSFAGEEGKQAFVEMFASICVDWCMTMKHPQFAVEKEWRLATRWGLEHRILTGRSFRPSASGITPYLSMKVRGDDAGDGINRLPIKSITVGPCNQPEIQRRTIQELLYQRAMADVEVVISELPIRI